MKRFILNVLLFFVIVTMVDVCVGNVGDYLQSHARGGETRQFDDFVAKTHHDVVILGSSRAHHHYDTPYLSDTLGLDVYNAGNDGNGVILAYGLFEMILERYQPQLVLFDVEPAFDINIYEKDNNHIRYISLLKPYFRNDEVDDVIKSISYEEWCKVRSGLIRYNSSLISKAVDYWRTGNVELQGFKPLYGQYSIDNVGEIENKPQQQVDSFKLEYVEKLIKASKNHKVQIVFIASPKYGEVCSQELQPVKEICAHYHVVFLDYYTVADFQKPYYFKEPMHLNAEGARAFSKTISREIQSRIKSF